MITKSDWEAVRQQFERQNHQMAEEPPATDELLAYTRGELRAGDAERVREYLAANPDVARALTEPFPEDDAKPGDLGYLSPEELDRHWTLLHEEIHGSAPLRAPVPFPAERRWRRLTMGLAAMLVLAFAGNLWQAQSNARLAKRLDQWQIASDQVLIPPAQGRRGGGETSPTTLEFEKDAYAIVLQPSGVTRSYADYRIDTVETKESRVVKSQSGFKRGRDGITFVVNRDELQPGAYEFRLFGLDGDRAVPLETYPLRVR